MQYIPHNYQAYCIQLVTELPAVGLFLRPGLGKTSITLSAVNILKYFRFQVARVLVVAPKKVAEATWQKEAARWDHTQHLRISTVLGSASKRIKALSTPADIYVINRENVEWLVDYYKQAWPFDMVVLDESTSFKNSQSKRFMVSWGWSATKSWRPLTRTPVSCVELWMARFSKCLNISPASPLPRSIRGAGAVRPLILRTWRALVNGGPATWTAPRTKSLRT